MSSDDSSKDLLNENRKAEFQGLDLLLQEINLTYSIEPITQDQSGSSIKKHFITRLLDPYVTRSNQFRTSLVKTLNLLASLIRHKEIAVTADYQLALESKKKELSSQFAAEEKKLSQRLAIVENENSNLRAQLKSLEDIVKGLELIMSTVHSVPTTNILRSSSDEVTLETATTKLDLDYLLLENRFRGSELVIQERMEKYLHIIVDSIPPGDLKYPVIEIGSGRGELLQLLKESKVPAIGVEPDSGMFEYSRAKGLDVVKEDAVSYLRKQGESKVFAVLAFQVVEHLSTSYLKHFLAEISRVLCTGGLVILETINTASLLPLTQNYFRDPTHFAPLHPDTLAFFVESAGLKIEQIKYSSDYPDAAKLQNISSIPEYPFRHQQLVTELNDRIRILNSIIFGPQDYAIIARKL